jgi:tRNA nucleotidyltransferase/poly(A) polymerase
LFKLLAAKGAAATLKLMAKTGILGHILPYTEKWRALSRLPPDPLLRLYALAAEPEALQDRLRLSAAEAKRIAAMRGFAPPTPELRPNEQRILLYQIGAEAWRDLVQIGFAQSRDRKDDRRWRRLLSLPERWQVPTFPVSGKDLIATGMQPGPELGAKLQELEDWWVASNFRPSKEELLARAGGVAQGRGGGDG